MGEHMLTHWMCVCALDGVKNITRQQTDKVIWGGGFASIWPSRQFFSLSGWLYYICLAKWPDLLGRSLSALKGFVCHRSCTRNPMLHIFNHTVSYLHSMDLFLSTLSGSNMSEQEMIQRHGNHICPQHMVLKVSNTSVVSDTPWETLQLVSLELQQNIPS